MTTTEVSAKRKAPARRRHSPRALKELWRTIRRPLANSAVVKHALAFLVEGGLRFVGGTNRLVPGSSDLATSMAQDGPAIYAVWHGQHLMYPTLYPKEYPIDVMVSRSSDAELNALVMKRFGVGIVRGSGGRSAKKSVEKGGARALLALKKSLDEGRSVAMVADIPNGTPRDAGMGIVMLARISGRPIFPAAYASSRRKVVERSWDKMTISLPFGRSAMVIGEPIHVADDATEAEMEVLRLAVTSGLNEVTVRAHDLVDAKPNQTGAAQ
ncbi:lysophospholipid acyltransferase family protein [Tianweitania populi]|uniref:lysophospholipid acyltransferase family protein n=1 Tax=Tianweitania populi TaxID=1607949 RepID=UPI001FCF147D|nr:lysophospholipid acyltransferase family protein [Tianweitania populi]